MLINEMTNQECRAVPAHASVSPLTLMVAQPGHLEYSLPRGTHPSEYRSSNREMIKSGHRKSCF